MMKKLTIFKNKIILFEINGVLVEYEKSYEKLYKNIKVRKGLIHLFRLKKHFRVGVYTTMSSVFTYECVNYIEKQIGHNFKFDIVLCANQCDVCPRDVRTHWSHMYKPIHKYFNIDKTILVDLKTAWIPPFLKDNVIGLHAFTHYYDEDVCISIIVDIIINSIRSTNNNNIQITSTIHLVDTIIETERFQISHWLRSNSC